MSYDGNYKNIFLFQFVDWFGLRRFWHNEAVSRFNGIRQVKWSKSNATHVRLQW